MRCRLKFLLAMYAFRCVVDFRLAALLIQSNKRDIFSSAMSIFRIFCPTLEFGVLTDVSVLQTWGMSELD